MISPVTDIKVWAERYKISLEPIPCPQCKNNLEWSQPVAFEGYRGLSTGICKVCKLDMGIFRVVPVDPEKLKFWESLNE